MGRDEESLAIKKYFYIYKCRLKSSLREEIVQDTERKKRRRRRRRRRRGGEKGVENYSMV